MSPGADSPPAPPGEQPADTPIPGRLQENQRAVLGLSLTDCKMISGHCLVAICYSGNWKLLTNS